MKIPKKVYRVLIDKKEFDYIFLEFLKDHSPEDAYDEAVDYIKKFAPRFKHYRDYSSYRSRRWKENNELIEIPKEIIEAVTHNIELLMHKHLKRVKIRKHAYEATVQEIQKWLPNYKPYSNYQSYRSSITARHKKKVKKVAK